jgi:hypothetical protein
VRVTGYFCQPFYNNCVERSVGTFVAWKADTLVLQGNGDTLAVSVDLVTRLDVSRGQTTNWKEGAWTGGLLGGVAGALIGYASYEECEGLSCWDLGPGLPALAGGVIGALGGALVGVLIGSASKTDRWQEVPFDRLRVTLAPQRDGRFAFGLSVRF